MASGLSMSFRARQPVVRPAYPLRIRSRTHGCARASAIEVEGVQGHTKQAVVIGAGPVGLASAAALASRGWKVDVLERRSDPTVEDSAQPVRTYPMSVNQRAKLAIDAADLNIDGYLQDRIRAGTPDMHLVDWRNLTCNLLASVRDRHGDAVTFHWRAGLGSAQDISLQDKMVLVDHGCGDGSAPATLAYDLLVGADGANSLVRDALARDGHLKSKVVYDSTMPPGRRYKVFHGLDPALDSRFASMATADVQLKPLPVGKWLLLMLWRKDSTEALSAMAIATEEDFGSEEFGNRLREDSDMPCEWADSITEQNKSTPVSVFGRIVHNSAFAGPSAIIVGDAAHAVTSSLGQGCNVGLSGVRHLMTILDREMPVEAVPATFSKEWSPQAHAFQLLENMNARKLRGDATAAALNAVAFLASIGTHLLLRLRLLPHAKFPASQYFVSWIVSPDVSYKRCVTNYMGCAALGGGVVAALLWLLSRAVAYALQSVGLIGM